MHLLSSQINFIPAISPCEIIEIITAHMYTHIFAEGNVRAMGFSPFGELRSFFAIKSFTHFAINI